jgi:hypothetical protein
MTSTTATNTARPDAPHAPRFTRWGGWLVFLLLCGHLLFCHGCHGEDVDDELCIPPNDRRQTVLASPQRQQGHPLPVLRAGQKVTAA